MTARTRVGTTAATAMLAGAVALGLLAGGGSAAQPGTNGVVAFASTRDDPNGDIYSMPATPGASAIRVNANSNANALLAKDGQPSWTPDGSRIVFWSTRGNASADIYAMQSDGSAATPLTTSLALDQSPEVSPDGSKVVFVSNRTTPGGAGNPLNIWVMNIDGSNPVPLTDDLFNDSRPTWSPDGGRIAWMSTRGGGDYEIWVMNANGTNPVSLTKELDPVIPDLEPDWSPDGTKIAFASKEGSATFEVWTMNADGSGKFRATTDASNNQYPAWSPDGKKIAFVSDRDGNSEIYVMNPDGSGQANLTNSAASDSAPAWQPIRPAGVTPPPPGPPGPVTGTTPPPATKVAGQVSGRARFSVRILSGGFNVVKLSVFGVTKGATVSVTCAKGCKLRRAVVLKKVRSQSFTALFSGRKLPLTTAIEIRITKPGAVGKYFKYRVTPSALVLTECRITVKSRLSGCVSG